MRCINVGSGPCLVICDPGPPQGIASARRCLHRRPPRAQSLSPARQRLHPLGASPVTQRSLCRIAHRSQTRRERRTCPQHTLRPFLSFAELPHPIARPAGGRSPQLPGKAKHRHRPWRGVVPSSHTEFVVGYGSEFEPLARTQVHRLAKGRGNGDLSPFGKRAFVHPTKVSCHNIM